MIIDSSRTKSIASIFNSSERICTMAKILAAALVATLLAACAGSGPSIQNSDSGKYWKNYGNGHGADANGG
jgi:hypothetical protein